MKVQSTTSELGLDYKPENIFNVDETGFSSGGSNLKVFAEKGVHRVNQLTGNNEKIMYTVQVREI
jgi:hypothetical protein